MTFCGTLACALLFADGRSEFHSAVLDFAPACTSTRESLLSALALSADTLSHAAEAQQDAV